MRQITGDKPESTIEERGGRMAYSGESGIWGRGLKLVLLVALCSTVAACGTTKVKHTPDRKRSKEYFSEKEYGVKASPRVHYGRNVPKGGGRDLTGKPYKVKGKWYVPKEDKKYNKVGLASWYGSAFHGRLTANGEVYDQYHLSAAHPTFPLPSYARVTNLENGDSVIVRVNDRGPYHPGRIIDLSNKAAEMLEVQNKGTAKVRVQYVGRARMDGRDMPYLLASFSKKGNRLKRFDPQGDIATGVMVASADDKCTLPKAQPDDVDFTSTATALQSPTGIVTASFDVMQEYAVLPEYGPVPAERPSRYDLTNGPVAAYAEIRIEQATTPFDAMLTSRGKLDAASIRKSALRRSN